jgi:hypothetical protein
MVINLFELASYGCFNLLRSVKYLMPGKRSDIMWLVRFHCVQVVLTTLGFTRSFCMLMQLVTDGLLGKFLHANATSHRWALGEVFAC